MIGRLYNSQEEEEEFFFFFLLQIDGKTWTETQKEEVDRYNLGGCLLKWFQENEKSQRGAGG